MELRGKCETSWEKCNDCRRIRGIAWRGRAACADGDNQNCRPKRGGCGAREDGVPAEMFRLPLRQQRAEENWARAKRPFEARHVQRKWEQNYRSLKAWIENGD